MAEVLLISAKKVKAFTAIQENLDSELLQSQIMVAQKIGLQTLLGTEFLEHLKDAVQNSTLTPAEETLLNDYVADYLVHRAYWECLPHVYIRTSNQALIKGQSEQGSTGSIEDLKYLRNVTKERYQFFAQRLTEFIEDHQSDYPIYFRYNSNEGMKADRNQKYFGGIVVPSRVNKYYRGDSDLPSWDEPYSCK